ncbi:hypothetical protein cypCar_00031823 [Cyprinus carpio]|nr:hypothetical protein cypCar_00031823 [Cyprinus carpio]
MEGMNHCKPLPKHRQLWRPSRWWRILRSGCEPTTILSDVSGPQGVLSNISSITDLGGFDPVWLFIVVGGVMFILGFAGCIGALRENTFLLKFFSVFLGLIFFLELTAGILAFVFKDWIKDQLNFFINNNVKAYRDDIDLQNLIDFAQEYEDVLNTQCGYDVRLQGELDQQKYIYTKGCVGQFEKWLQDNLIIVAGIFVGIALLQVRTMLMKIV